MTRVLAVLLLMSFLSGSLAAKPNEFQSVVNTLKKHYKARQLRVPLVFGMLGLGARLYTHGAVKGLKVAVFPDQDLSAAVNDKAFEPTIASHFDHNWIPMLRVFSRRDSVRTYLYAREAGKDYQVVLTALQRDGGAVVSVKLNPAQLAKFIEKHSGGESIMAELGLGNRSETAASSSGATTEKPAQIQAEKAAEVETETGANAPANRARDVTESTPAGNNVTSPSDAPKADLTIDTRLVSLNAAVLNSNGIPLTRLNAEDFRIYENQVPQKITHFTPVTAPVNLLLVLDYSGSTEKKKDVMKEAARRFVNSLSPGDRVAVAVFARRYKLACEFTSDRKVLNKVIKDLSLPSSGTAYYDAMWKSLEVFNDLNSGRNAIIVLTDGVDNSISRPRTYAPSHPFDKLFERITNDNVTIYPLYLDTEYETVEKRRGPDTHETYAVARKQLQEIADQTGGRVYRVNDVKDLDQVYSKLAAELRTLYSIAYAPADDSAPDTRPHQWREIKLEVMDKSASVRTRKGYWTK